MLGTICQDFLALKWAAFRTTINQVIASPFSPLPMLLQGKDTHDNHAGLQIPFGVWQNSAAQSGGLGSIGRTKMSAVRTEELDPRERETRGPASHRGAVGRWSCSPGGRCISISVPTSGLPQTSALLEGTSLCEEVFIFQVVHIWDAPGLFWQ